MGNEKRNAASPPLIKELLRGCREIGEVEGVCVGEALLPHFYCPSTYTKCQKERGGLPLSASQKACPVNVTGPSPPLLCSQGCQERIRWSASFHTIILSNGTANI